MSHDDRKDKLQLLALLSTIHGHLASGRTIHPNTVEVLNPNPDAWTKKNAPTITAYIGGILEEMMAEDLLEKEHQKFMAGRK